MDAQALGATLVLVGLVGAVACDGPTSPSTPTPTSAAGAVTSTPTPTPSQGEIPTRLTITGSTSSAGTNDWSTWFGMVPGETATFTATATFADGTDRDVTASATWATFPGSPARVLSPGVLRAEVAGWTPVGAVYRSGQTTVHNEVLVRVAPPGVFLLDFSVNDGRWEISGALVRAVSNAGTFSTTTIAIAPVSLPAVGDTVVEVAAGAGFAAPFRSSLTVASDMFADCNVQPPGSCRFAAY